MIEFPVCCNFFSSCFIILQAQLHFKMVIYILSGTFDVQNVEVRLTNTEYEITCYFASGSEARGCRIVLTNNQGEGKEECNAQRLEGVGEAVIKAMLPAGEYSLLVYDDDDDSMGQENPAYHTLVSSTSSDLHNMGIYNLMLANFGMHYVLVFLLNKCRLFSEGIKS